MVSWMASYWVPVVFEWLAGWLVTICLCHWCGQLDGCLLGARGACIVSWMLACVTRWMASYWVHVMFAWLAY